MLEESHIKPYWEQRSATQGARTVGYGGDDIAIQDKRYMQRSNFIFQLCPRDLKTFDYGCGIGRYASYFEKYTGVDITPSLLDIARAAHPNKEFILQDSVYPDLSGDWELLFITTVMQHCCDDVVDEIFRRLSRVGFRYVFIYENMCARQAHVSGRKFGEYMGFVEKHFDVFACSCSSHVIHNEKHGAMLISCSKNCVQ